jgi:hypothetical protein
MHSMSQHTAMVSSMMCIAIIELLVIFTVVTTAMVITRSLVAPGLGHRHRVMLLLVAVKCVVVLFRITASNLPVFAAPLDAFVAVLVQTSEIRPETAVVRSHAFGIGYICEADCQIA